MLLGWKANPHFGPFHLLSFAFIGGGFILIAACWRVLHEAQRRHALADAYAYVPHPRYVGFVLVMLSFLLRWPTLLALAMFPILVFMYVRLARTEEQEVLAEFGDACRRYIPATPGWIPRLGNEAGKRYSA